MIANLIARVLSGVAGAYVQNHWLIKAWRAVTDDGLVNHRQYQIGRPACDADITRVTFDSWVIHEGVFNCALCQQRWDDFAKTYRSAL